MANIEGILFDCDGVLVDHKTGFAIKNVQQTLELLKQVPMAVCSNSYVEDLEHKIQGTNLHSYFELLVGAGTNPKPHPEVFLKGAAGLRKHIFNCLAVEDSVVGLKAAIASGAISVAYAPTKELREELEALRPEFIITDILELVELYNQLNGGDNE
tara:strand:+ start:3040 stop:3507 length:468 start_codon:yes stop_codon:yes gene_type:complete